LSVSSFSPLTGSSLTNVPLVLPKSRTKTLPPLMSRAQWRLLITGLVGRNWHCGSRPITNWGSVTGIACPLAFPSDITTRLTFMGGPHSPRRSGFENGSDRLARKEPRRPTAPRRPFPYHQFTALSPQTQQALKNPRRFGDAGGGQRSLNRPG